LAIPLLSYYFPVCGFSGDVINDAQIWGVSHLWEHHGQNQDSKWQANSLALPQLMQMPV